MCEGVCVCVCVMRVHVSFVSSCFAAVLDSVHSSDDL